MQSYSLDIGEPYTGHTWCLLAWEGQYTIIGINSIVLLEGNDIGDGLFMTVTMTDDELECDAPRRASPGSSSR